MNTKDLIELLLERGYDGRSAQLVASELLQLCEPLLPLFESWLSDTDCQKDYCAEGYSISSLMKERNMTYPAALLTMDWIIKEPQNALRSLKRGIK